MLARPHLFNGFTLISTIPSSLRFFIFQKDRRKLIGLNSQVTQYRHFTTAKCFVENKFLNSAFCIYYKFQFTKDHKPKCHETGQKIRNKGLQVQRRKENSYQVFLIKVRPGILKGSCQSFFICSLKNIKPIPLNRRCKLNVHKTFRRRPGGHSIYVLCPGGTNTTTA